MENLNSARIAYLGEFKEVLELLKAGDPHTVELYREVVERTSRESNT